MITELSISAVVGWLPVAHFVHVLRELAMPTGRVEQFRAPHPTTASHSKLACMTPQSVATCFNYIDSVMSFESA
jgi:hypothetical protein